jgi:metal-dependent amidase/aminoacylase/carboxypeptidase family protein
MRFLIVVSVLLGTGSTFAQAPTSNVDEVIRLAESLRDTLVQVRRDIHMYPELSGQEKRTAKLVADWLNRIGLEVETGVGGTGVVGILRGAKDGPVVAYRADMDAVWSASIGDAPYRSRVPGVKHECGHDVHVAVGLGIATVLTSFREDLAGTVMFIFQPAEENVTGARAMLADGIFDRIKPAAIYALHTSPAQVGSIAVTPGVGLSGTEIYDASIVGRTISSETINGMVDAFEAMSTVPPAGTPDSWAILSEAGVPDGKLSSFILANAFPMNAGFHPDQATIRVYVKASGRDAYAEAYERMTEILTETTEDGGSWDLVPVPPTLPDMHSDSVLARRAIAPIEQAIGEGQVRIMYASIPYFGEDFAVFLEEIPGAMFFLGVGNAEKGIRAANHSPDYDVDEEGIVVGTKAMTNVILDYLTLDKQ